MQIFLSSSAKRCRYGANYEALRRALWAQKSLVTVTSDYHWQGSKVQKYPDKELLACSSTLQHFNPKSNKWRRFSTAVTIVREEEDDDHEVKKDVSASEGDKSLIQVARSFCYGLKYTKKNFQESETVRKEALRILQQLTGVGHRQSVDTSIALAERLRSACDVDPIDAELLNRILRNWANCPDVRTSTKELKPIEALIATPNVDLYAIILQKIGSNSNSLSLEEYIRQTCSRYQELCADDEAMRQQLDEITENIIVQFKARKPDTLVDAMEKAKEDVGRGFKLHEDTFLSILFGALTSPPEKRPQVKEFLTWAGEQYDANSLAIQVESIFLFGWASQVKTESGSEPPEWLLQCIGWIGEKVTADVRATTEDYERAIKLWAMAGQGLRAKALLMNMLQSENSNVVPTLGCYNTVLACLAESDDSKKGSIAVELLDQMNSDKNPELIPNYATYQLTLDRLRSSKEQSAPVEAIRIVREMTDASKSEALSMRAPTSILYSNVANGLRFQQDDWRPMDEFLKWLEEQKEEGNQQARVDIYHYDQLLILKSRSEEPDIAEMGISIFDKVQKMGLIGPGSAAAQFLHTLCNNCLSHPDASDAAAVEVIARAISLHDEFYGDQIFQLRTNQYWRAMQQFACVGQAEKTEEFTLMSYRRCQRGQGPQPSVDDFNVVLEAWGTSLAPRAAARADAIVHHMHKLDGVQLNNSKPNRESYQHLLRCWENSSLPEAKERADRIRVEISKLPDT